MICIKKNEAALVGLTYFASKENSTIFFMIITKEEVEKTDFFLSEALIGKNDYIRCESYPLC